MTTDGDGPRPPGRLGPPFIGETLALIRNPFRFLEVRQRRHGNVFKSRVLGREVVFLAGTEGAEAFYDGDNVVRSDAHPYPIVDLFGGVNMEMYDGPDHRALKEMALDAFGPDAIASYLPGLELLIDERLARWAGDGEFGATAELRRLAIEAISLNLLGLEPGEVTDAFCRDYARVLKGIVSVPLAVPGTPYGAARAARDRLLATIRDEVSSRRARPADDGLSRMLGARTPDGRVYTDEEAVLEVHHIMIAGLIVYALMGEVVRRLAQDPPLAERCAAEVHEHLGEGPLTLGALSRLAISTNVVLETKRTVPLVPLAFGRARRDFLCAGRRVPDGWRVYLALHLCNFDPNVYADPERFDPERFGPGRAEHLAHPFGFIPQGAGPPTGHQCLGLDYSTYLTLAFLTLLVRGYQWELPAQSFAYRWNTIPPEPRDGLRVQIRPRPSRLGH